jgi:DNA polymerase-1
MGDKKLAAKLGIELEAARTLFAKYHENAPFVRGLQKATTKAAEKRGYIRTFLGRRARFDMWESTDWDEAKAYGPMPQKKAQKQFKRIRRANVYKAMNRHIQGTAADVLKKSMSEIWKSGVCDVLGAPHLTVHDELDWSIPHTAEANEAHKEVLNIMENSVKFSVPLTCDTESGNSWGTVE